MIFKEIAWIFGQFCSTDCTDFYSQLVFFIGFVLDQKKNIIGTNYYEYYVCDNCYVELT